MQTTKQLLPLSEDGKVCHQKVKRWQEYDFMGKLCHYKTVARYRDGKKHGNFDSFCNGQIESSTPYVDGKIHGKQRVWSKSGKLYSFTHYFEGKLHGLHRSFHIDGEVAWELRYVHGAIFDEDKFWGIAGDSPASKKQSER